MICNFLFFFSSFVWGALLHTSIYSVWGPLWHFLVSFLILTLWSESNTRTFNGQDPLEGELERAPFTDII
jgi:hypothetical protein